jgi:hypothetical protein
MNFNNSTTARNHTTDVQAYQLLMDYPNEWEEQSAEPQVDYLFDAYVLVIVFGIVPVAITSTLAMYLYSEYKQSLLRQSLYHCSVEIVDIALSNWTIASDVSEDSGLDIAFPDHYAVLENLERS